MDVTVVIASYGDEKWSTLARDRARPSVVHQTEKIIVLHSTTGNLADIRNAGLERVTTEWVCFLDADDELEPGFIQQMARGGGDLRVPSVRYVSRASHPSHNRVMMPKVVGHRHQCAGECLLEGNWMVIGTVARTEQMKAVGGFDNYPVYEDYALWAKMWKAGSVIEAHPKAIYRAHVRPDSRNRASMSASGKHRTHQQIARDIGLTVPA